MKQLKEFLIEANDNSFLLKTINRLKKLNPNKIKQKLLDSFKQLTDLVKEEEKEDDFLSILNKRLNTNFSSMDDLIKSKLKEDVLNEDWKNFTKLFKMEFWPVLTIFPSLQLWFEFDKLLNTDKSLDFKKIAIYGTIWILLILGKHIKNFKKWKKENPEEWKKEGSKPSAFSL